MNKFLLIIILPLFLSSCSTTKIVGNQDSSKNINKHINGHTVLIIKQRKEVEHYARFNFYSNYTTMLEDMYNDMTNKGYKVITAPVTVFSTGTLDDVRSLASRYGADKVIVVREKYKADSGINILSITYLTLIGMYLFPGNNLKSVCNLEAEIIDIKSGEQDAFYTSAAKSHLYIYRIGNTDAVLYSSFKESQNKALEILLNKIYTNEETKQEIKG